MDSDRWYFHNGNNKAGPFNEGEALKFINENSNFFDEHILIFNSSWEDWRKCNSTAELLKFLEITTRKKIEQKIDEEKKGSTTYLKKLKITTFLAGFVISFILAYFLFGGDNSAFIPPTVKGKAEKLVNEVKAKSESKKFILESPQLFPNPNNPTQIIIHGTNGKASGQISVTLKLESSSIQVPHTVRGTVFSGKESFTVIFKMSDQLGEKYFLPGIYKITATKGEKTLELPLIVGSKSKDQIIKDSLDFETKEKPKLESACKAWINKEVMKVQSDVALIRSFEQSKTLNPNEAIVFLSSKPFNLKTLNRKFMANSHNLRKLVFNLYTLTTRLNNEARTMFLNRSFEKDGSSEKGIDWPNIEKSLKSLTDDAAQISCAPRP